MDLSLRPRHLVSTRLWVSTDTLHTDDPRLRTVPSEYDPVFFPDDRCPFSIDPRSPVTTVGVRDEWTVQVSRVLDRTGLGRRGGGQGESRSGSLDGKGRSRSPPLFDWRLEDGLGRIGGGGDGGVRSPRLTGVERPDATREVEVRSGRVPTWDREVPDSLGEGGPSDRGQTLLLWTYYPR